jgi:hypothetical protein
MEQKITRGQYSTLAEFTDDFRLLCRNAMQYNPAETIYFKEAATLLSTGDKLIEAAENRIQREAERAQAPKHGADDTVPAAAGIKRSRVVADAFSRAVGSGNRPVKQPGRSDRSAVSVEDGQSVLSERVGDNTDDDDEDLSAEDAVSAAARRRKKKKKGQGVAGSDTLQVPSAKRVGAAASARPSSSLHAADSSSDDGGGCGVAALTVHRDIRGITVHVAVPFAVPSASSLLRQRENVDLDDEEDVWVCAVCDDGFADTTSHTLVQCSGCSIVVHQVRSETLPRPA